MNKVTKHPLRIAADSLRNAFARYGFVLYDNGTLPELEKTDINVRIFESPDEITSPILLSDGSIALRTSLLPFVLPKMKSAYPVKGAAFGKVFDGSDPAYPARHKIEGVIASDLNLYDLNVLFGKIIKTAFGAAYEAKLVKTGSAKKQDDLSSWGTSAMKETSLYRTATWSILVTRPDGTEFIPGYLGTMTWIGCALLGVNDPAKCHAFSIDVDRTACEVYDIKDRAQLYDNKAEFLEKFTDGSVSASESFEDLCRDVLRTMGYSEGFGMKLYPDGIYKKMNMIQDSWDLNNQGVRLTEALGEGTGLPTVLTPAIEQILCEKWEAGEKSAKAFEISHIFIPQKEADPIEKLALSFGAYGEAVTLKSFTAEVDRFLTAIGNKNHFFLPNNQAIAYKTGECRLILDERMSYLGGNFGGISETAEENFRIGTHAYMANLELMPLEHKAAEEYGYIAPELR